MVLQNSLQNPPKYLQSMSRVLIAPTPSMQARQMAGTLLLGGHLAVKLGEGGGSGQVEATLLVALNRSWLGEP
jgi:hypothetical protein